MFAAIPMAASASGTRLAPPVLLRALGDDSITSFSCGCRRAYFTVAVPPTPNQRGDECCCARALGTRRSTIDPFNASPDVVDDIRPTIRHYVRPLKSTVSRGSAIVTLIR